MKDERLLCIHDVNNGLRNITSEFSLWYHAHFSYLPCRLNAIQETLRETGKYSESRIQDCLDYKVAMKPVAHKFLEVNKEYTLSTKDSAIDLVSDDVCVGEETKE
jgi:hypothetical protein